MPLSSPLVFHKQPYAVRSSGGFDYSFMRDNCVLVLLAAPGPSTSEFEKFLAFIPQAVNAFEPMREALRELVVALTHDDNPQNEFVRARLIDARAALKLAGDATTNSQEPTI